MDPLRPIRTGEGVQELLSASRFNTLSAAARAIQSQSRSLGVQHGAGIRYGWQSAVKVLSWYTGATIRQRGELVPLTYPLWAANAAWSGTDVLKEKPFDAGVLPSAWYATHANPRYASWGVALEPIRPFRFGRVAVSGLAVVRMNYRSAVSYTSVGGWVDVHPDPDSEEGDDPRWGLERAHGRAKLLTKFYRDPPGGGDREYYAVVDLDRPSHVFPVQAKTTNNTPSATSVACYTGHSTSPNTLDTITLRRTNSRAIGLAVGKDDLTSSGLGTLGWAEWTGEWNRSSEDGAFYVRDWPERFEVEVQSAFDGYPFTSSGIASVKLYTAEKDGGAGCVGDAFSVPVGIEDGIRTTGATTQWATVHGAEDARATVLADCTEDLSGPNAWLDPAPWLDAPYGTIRMMTGVTITGTGPYPGWLWCDGTSGTPDLREKFVCGATAAGGDRVLDTTGGQAIHGGNTNDHDAHTIDDHETQLVQLGTDGAMLTVVIGKDHTVNNNHGVGSDETNNEPPWYAVAFAIRASTV